MIRIAVDAMGGDHAPRSIIDGALAAARHLDLGLMLAGPAEVDPRRARDDIPTPMQLNIRILDAPDVIGMAEAPVGGAAAQAARVDPRRGRVGRKRRGVGAGQRRAHRRNGAVGSRGVRHAAWCRSSGAGGDHPVGRPARHSAGCRRQCRMPATHLLQFGAMGAVYAKVSLGIDRPRIGLLSIGEEESKGTELIRDAHQLLKASSLEFHRQRRGARSVQGQSPT